MTIKDIARLSGCGPATVSRVLNHRPDVSEETRRRVLAVVEEQGFQVNSNARHLKQNAGTGAAILVKGTSNMLFADLVERLQAGLRERDRDAAVYYLDEEADEVAFAVQLCRERKPQGLMFLGGDLEHFRAGFGQIGAPAVLLTNTARALAFPNLSSLTTDDFTAAERAAEYLMNRGHRCIGVLGGNRSCSQIGFRRVEGCRAALAARGLTLPETRCEPCRYALEDACRAAKRLIERCPELTAVFALSDVTAIGAIRALRDLGRRVPEDISVVGYDGVALARYSVPRLVTVRQDTRKLAQRGVEALLRGIRGAPPVHDLVPFRLLEGESVKDLRG